MKNEPTEMPIPTTSNDDKQDTPKKDENIKVNIKDIQGDVITLSLNENDTVQKLIEQYKNLKGLPRNCIILIYKDGRKALEEKTLKSLNIQDDVTLNCAIRLPGGRRNI